MNARNMADTRPWRVAKLGDVCEKITDGTHHSPPNGQTGAFKYITAKNIRPIGLDLTDVTYVDAATHREIYSRCDVRENDILYVKDGATTGRVALNTLEEEFSLLSSVGVLRPNRQHVLPKYLLYALQAPTVKDRMLADVAGVAITRLTLKTLKAAEIPLAPLDLQGGIVAELETQLSRLDEAVANLQRVKAKLERYRASTLGQVTTGLGDCLSAQKPASTELDEVGQDLGVPLPALPQHWKWTTVGMLGSVRGGKRLPLGHKYATERTSFPYLRVTDFGEFGIDDSGLQYLSAATRRAIERYTIGTKDVYISIAGSIGLVGQVPAHLDNANLTENAAKITGLQSVEPKFLIYWLASPIGRRLIAKSTIATTQSKLALFRIEKLPVPLPPVDEQRCIVAEVDCRLSIVREVEAEVDANLKRAQALRRAVLVRAFAVPSEPGQ